MNLVYKNDRIMSFLLSMEPGAAAKKSYKLMWRCHQLLSGFLAKGHLPRD